MSYRLSNASGAKAPTAPTAPLSPRPREAAFGLGTGRLLRARAWLGLMMTLAMSLPSTLQAQLLPSPEEMEASLSGEETAVGGEAEPGEDQEAEPGENQAAEPSENQAAEPSENQAAEPSENQAAEPSENQAAEPSATPTGVSPTPSTSFGAALDAPQDGERGTGAAFATDEESAPLIADEIGDAPLAVEAPPVAAPSEAARYAPLQDGEVRARPLRAAVNEDGGLGLVRLATARPGEPGVYRLTLLGAFFTGRNAVRQNDEVQSLAGNLALQATLHRHVSAYGALQTRNYTNSFGQPESMLTQGDLLAGVRLHAAPLAWLDVALDTTAWLPSGWGTTGLAWSSTSARARLAATMDVGALVGPVGAHLLPMDAHLNVGYRLDNSEAGLPAGLEPTRVERAAYGLSSYDMVELDAGLTWAFGRVMAFGTWHLGVPVGDPVRLCRAEESLPCAWQAGFGAFPHTVAVGARAEPLRHLGLQAAAEFGLTGDDAQGLPVTLPWQLHLGLSWTFDASDVPAPAPAEGSGAPMGYVVGVVVDAESGEPVPNAVVRYLERAESNQASAVESGTFRSYGFAPGTLVRLDISHPDYIASQHEYTAQTGDQELVVVLRPLAKLGVLKGYASDPEGNAIPEARVRITGKESFELVTDENGSFAQDAPPGAYTLAVSAPGFQTAGRDVMLEKRGMVHVDVMLRQSGKPLVEVSAEELRIQDRVFFETGQSIILPRSYPLLDEVVSTLLENPQIRLLRVDGHTDDVGSEDHNMRLSVNRANAVRRYVIEKGISAERLDARGFGNGVPLVPNLTERNRSINRRVEFKIIEK